MALGQNVVQRSDDPRPVTELETIIGRLEDRLHSSLKGLSAIASRVMPPLPQAATGAVSPVASTYAEKLRALDADAERLTDYVNALGALI